MTDFARRHSDAQSGLARWEEVVSAARWRHIMDVRVAFPHADAVPVAKSRVVTVFNLSGNKFRLVTAIHYSEQTVVVMAIMTHAEYSKEKWKEFV